MAISFEITYVLYNTSIMQSLDTAFFALSDGTRRAILARLVMGEATVMELVEPFEMSQPAVSRHLKVLEAAGLITRRIEGTRRPCRVNADGLGAVTHWLDTLRVALERNYNRLDHVLAAMETSPTKGRKKR